MIKILSIAIGLALTPFAFASDLGMLQSQWAQVTYDAAEDERVRGLEDLADIARQSSEKYPNDAEILIWEGIIISSLAGKKGGFGALGLAKEAKAALEASLTIDDTALDGSAYTSLGTLHHKVPGWPIGFGSDKKARRLLQQALALNPGGIDPNYFMGEFLYDEGEYVEARRYLQAALRAPDRPGRTVADEGRRAEIRALTAKLDAKRK